jgi:serine-type D-Ala-D-Ala carboxypeptidase/endopeptidase (penicillin-binding protein 4)
MLDLITANLLAWLLHLLGRSQPKLQPLQPLTWNDTAIFQLPQGEIDPVMNKVLQDYLKNLEQQGIDLQQQGIWLESAWIEPAGNRESVAISAASLTKIATTLAALSKLGADHQFATKVYVTGKIQQGVLNGDLIIEGSGDPVFCLGRSDRTGQYSK